MRVAVCMKQVADSESRLKIGPEGRWIEEDDLPFMINGSDEYALEEALRIAESTGGEVVVFSLGPDRVREALRKALALGATRAVHLDDPAFASGDYAANGRALAAAIGRESFDLVLTGSQSDDVGYGATGTIIAGRLGWPHAWLVMGVEIENGGSTAKVTREMESGLNEVFRIQLPAVLEIQAGINKPRYASLKGIMQAKRKEITSADPAALGLTNDEVGGSGAKIEIVEIAFPAKGEGAQMLEGNPQEVAALLVEKLKKEARIL